MAREKNILTALEARSLDLKAKKNVGIMPLILMENAGSAVAREAVKILKQRKKVVIICGKGNNGGDGFVIARHLLTKGIKPEIFLSCKIKEIKNEAQINLQILKKLKQKIVETSESNLKLVKRKFFEYDLIIDALLGVGLSGEVRGIYRELIILINSSKAYVLSVDIPSGLDATGGNILGCCVKADKTVTFMAKKIGMIVGDGPKVCGKIVVKDLGVPFYLKNN